MVAVGISYLIYQKKIIANSRSKLESTVPAQNGLSRALIGVQVGKHFG